MLGKDINNQGNPLENVAHQALPGAGVLLLGFLSSQI